MSEYARLSVHRWMLRDAIRNEAFRQALLRAVKPGDVVLDMGAGTGILSVFAAQAGASKVYAIERTETAKLARRIVEANGFSDRIEVLQCNMEDATLPGRANVIVSEWMGGFGVDENMLAPLVMARDRWLAPGGVIVPGTITAWIAPAEIAEWNASMAHWRSRPHGLDLGLVAQLTAQETHNTQVHIETRDLMAPPAQMWSHDPMTCSLATADAPFTTSLTFTATRAGIVSGFPSWFTADMGGGHTLTNAVGAPDTHWGRTLFALDRPVEVGAGTPLKLDLSCDPSTPGTCEMSWTVTIGDRPPEYHDTRPSRRR